SESAEESLKEETSSLSEKEQFLSYLTSLNETHRYTARLSYSVLSEDGEEHMFPYGIQEQYGDQALLWLDEERAINSGVLINGEQGVFDFSIANGELVLGNFSFFDAGEPMGELYSTPIDFANPRYWVEDEEGGFHSNSRQVSSALTSLSGLLDLENHYGVEFSAGTAFASLSENGFSVAMDALLEGEVSARGYIEVVDIGETKNQIVEDYLKNPRVVTARTKWSDDDLTTISHYFAGDLPFPEGASYTLSVNSLDDYLEVIIADCASGDLSASYKAQLEALGYHVEFKSEHSQYVAEKETVGEKEIATDVVIFSYFSQSEIEQAYGKETAEFYPYGRFQIEAYTDTVEIHTYEEGIAALAKYSQFPTPSFSDVSHTVINDLTESFEAYLSAYVTVSFYCENQTVATANLNAYAEVLKEAGFTLDADSTETHIALTSSTGEKAKYVDLNLALTEDNSYLGYFEVTYIAE
ncbi:MAG: hypothetical protein SPI58_01665, partial [Candidatus Enteromonas sp.]|nr:hypothetical protein [Candidatus Enteromonas sp.]